MNVKQKTISGSAGHSEKGIAKQSLSTNQQRFVELLSRIRFGRLPRLIIERGEPSLQGLQWKRTIKIPGDNTPHPGFSLDDFDLKHEMVLLLRQFAEIRDGMIYELEIRNGLPVTYQLEESIIA